MNYHHLIIEERCCIREFYKKGLSYRKIAELIGRSPSIVSREINRNRTLKWNALYWNTAPLRSVRGNVLDR